MNNLDNVSLAAGNNAAWCDAMLRAHGCATHFSEHLWFTTAPAPRYYPNVVTLSGAAATASQLATIGALAAAARETHMPFAVKDSFNLLDLAPLGFSCLFEAEWLQLPADRRRQETPPADASWQVVATAAELRSWEAGWGDSGGAALFPAALLDDARVRVLACRQDGRVVAGCVTCHDTGAHDAGVVGYTNLFVPDQDSDAWRASAIAMIAAEYQDLPIVGYESGGDITAMRRCGFETIGALRVWAQAA
ncbi:MAG TPA: hypothetical protein VND94_01335 [Terriglobia bacterium]|nr:hypothetical protein [Terriglobia bacterium]